MSKQIIQGGDTSALTTQKINSNFTELYNRQPYVVSEGTEQSSTTITYSGVSQKPIWHYRIWSNGYYEADTYVAIDKNHPVVTEGNIQGFDEYSNGLEIPQIAYPTVITNLGYNFAPTEFASLTCSVASSLGVSRSVAPSSEAPAGMNTKQHTASYAIVRGSWTGVNSFYFDLYIKIIPRSNQVFTPQV